MVNDSMQIYAISSRTNDSGGDELVLGIRSINQSLITAIVDCLNNDKNVARVRFIETHPELEDRKLEVVTNNGSAKDAISRAAKSVSEYFSKGLSPEEELPEHSTKSEVKQYATKSEVKQYATKSEVKQYATKSEPYEHSEDSEK